MWFTRTCSTHLEFFFRWIQSGWSPPIMLWLMARSNLSSATAVQCSHYKARTACVLLSCKSCSLKCLDSVRLCKFLTFFPHDSWYFEMLLDCNAFVIGSYFFPKECDISNMAEICLQCYYIKTWFGKATTTFGSVSIVHIYMWGTVSSLLTIPYTLKPASCASMGH